ncbi:hypothetical protein [uncultured Tateyamaria sp.]|uniref:hypothetical protein n=1 Tax=uncultured Tateyamaria sp. TaxID=455651 RepID=UPI002616EB9B|nr:hypothetical protein [uncultured Tateyamaria sp.]
MSKIGRLAIVLSILIGTPASAEEIGPEAASERLIGATWSGTNADGSEFWFYHAGDGRFKSRFVQRSKAAFDAGGEWKIAGNTICWAWDGWETHCYETFVLEGDALSMTRTDGVIHTGTVTLGDTEALN